MTACTRTSPTPDPVVRDVPGIEVLPSGYASLLARATTVFLGDERVRALWVSGSLGRGDADPSSDLDLLIAVADEGFDGFAATWRDWLAEITPTVLAKPLPFLPGACTR